jgi:hypothetical protein
VLSFWWAIGFEWNIDYDLLKMTEDAKEGYLFPFPMLEFMGSEE